MNTKVLIALLIASASLTVRGNDLSCKIQKTNEKSSFVICDQNIRGFVPNYLINIHSKAPLILSVKDPIYKDAGLNFLKHGCAYLSPPVVLMFKEGCSSPVCSGNVKCIGKEGTYETGFICKAEETVDGIKCPSESRCALDNSFEIEKENPKPTPTDGSKSHSQKASIQ